MSILLFYGIVLVQRLVVPWSEEQQGVSAIELQGVSHVFESRKSRLTR